MFQSEWESELVHPSVEPWAPQAEAQSCPAPPSSWVFTHTQAGTSIAQSVLFALGNLCCRRNIRPHPSSLHSPSLHFLTLTGGWLTSEGASSPRPPEWGRPYLWAGRALGAGWLLMASAFWKQTHTHVLLLPETYVNSPPQSHLPHLGLVEDLALPSYPPPTLWLLLSPWATPVSTRRTSYPWAVHSLPQLQKSTSTHRPRPQPNLSYHVIQGHLHSLHPQNLLHLQPCLPPSVWTPRSATFPSIPPVFSLCTHCVHSVPRTPIG